MQTYRPPRPFHGLSHWRMVALASLYVLVALFSGADEAMAQPVSPREGGGLPRPFLDVMAQDPTAYQFGNAYIAQVERLKRNRELLAQGKLDGSPEELLSLTVVSGNRFVPVMMGKYSDTGAAPIAAANLQQELFDGPWPTGTMTEYYEEISYGNLQVQGTVFDWVTVSNIDSYYTGLSAGAQPSNARTGEFITEILTANDPAVDFGQFDNDGPDNIPNSGDDDGFVDFIGIVHPEAGSECFGRDAARNPNRPDNFWSHRWRLDRWSSGVYITDDPRAGGGFIRVNDYTIMPSLACAGGGMIEIGVFCHKFGHAFGLADYYDTDGGGDGIGEWGLMGTGNWNQPTRPAHMNAYSKASSAGSLPRWSPAISSAGRSSHPRSRPRRSSYGREARPARSTSWWKTARPMASTISSSSPAFWCGM